MEMRNQMAFLIISGLGVGMLSDFTSGDWLSPLVVDVPLALGLSHPLTRTCLCSSNQLFLSRTTSVVYSLEIGSQRNYKLTNLQRISSGKALLAITARERLHSQMDPLMALQIMISIERLRALIASEGSLALLLLLSRMVSVHRPA